MPVMLGVLSGAVLGARFLFRARTASLRLVFSLVVFFLAIEMILHGTGGGP